ncbi:MAG: threonine-phosphate decarboxylase CobD [Rhodospirillales bacterium]
MTGKLRHGGDIDAAAKAFGTPAHGWLDLSTGINPVSYPVGSEIAEVWRRLPTASDEARLLVAARACYGVPEDAGIVAAPGTQAIIQWLPVAPAACRVQILGPTYEEHAKSWSDRGHSVEIIDDIKSADADVVIVVNPNNPDGRTVPPAALLETADRLAAHGGVLIVDEAFADVAPETSVTPETGRPGLLVLRSFGKFFGLAGLRLGFAVSTEFDTELLKHALGPWAVAGPALGIGARALADMDWQEKTRKRLTGDAKRLDELLTGAGMGIVGGTSLYRLARSADAPAIHEKLGRAGIMVRMFDGNPEWLRFGLPGTDRDWKRLERALD